MLFIKVCNRDIVRIANVLFILSIPTFSLFQANAQTYPATIKIPVTYYDFHSDGSNPEFEKTPTASATHTGMVNSILGPNRKPTVGSNPYWNCNISKWFVPWTAGDFTIPNYTNPATTACSNPFSTVNYDTAFKNITFQDTLLFSLVPGTQGTYQYSNDAFFPLDGKGFGADEANLAYRNHNYSFSMELHYQFLKVLGLIFRFESNDDMWVFVNNKLVIDIGGMHAYGNDSLNVDSLGLLNGSSYSFDLFHCQRHATGSSIQITTNISTQPLLSNLSYSLNPAIYQVNKPIPIDTPSYQGVAAFSYSIFPPVPPGLTFDTTKGILSGTPTIAMPMTKYKVIATNAGGSDTATLSITINSAPRLISAVASNGSSENVLLTFDKPVDTFAVTYQNINSNFHLSNGHSWLSGFGIITSAIWNPDSTMLLVNLSTTVSPPTIAVGDTIFFSLGQNGVVLIGNLSTGVYNHQIKNLAKYSINTGKNQIIFSIRPDLVENSKIKIQNLSGKLITDFQGSQRTILNCKSFSAGLYIARIYLKNNPSTSIPFLINP